MLCKRSHAMSEMPQRREDLWNNQLNQLIEMETWDWWKATLYSLREQGGYAEAEALFHEFKICS